MSSEIRQESPLAGMQVAIEAGLSGLDGQFALGECERPTLINLRGDSRSCVFLSAVKAATGTALPVTPNTINQGPDYAVAWLGPDEWLAQSQRPGGHDLRAAMPRLLAGEFASVTDVSSGSTILLLSGARVRDLLRKGCPLDLHPGSFGVGQCAQSHFFKAGIVVWPTADGAWHVVVRRSLTDYVVRMLLDAAEDYAPVAIR